MIMNTTEIAARRELFFATARRELRKYVNAAGEGLIPQLNPPFREPVWVLPALYAGSPDDIALANRMAERYNDAPATDGSGRSGKAFNIFQSNLFAGLLFEHHDKLTPKAREVMEWHAREVFKTYGGAAQSDYRFHGANDNMPMMATRGLILGGAILRDRAAWDYGVWNLNEFRRLLCRSAWASEFNSSTYSAVTVTNLAKIAELAPDPEVRRVALDCEARLWAELLLHFHPGTKLTAGPQCRAYEIDYAGHTHSLQAVLWMLFGPEATGRDPIASYFTPDGAEVIHFDGCYFQSVCEYCDMLDAHFHVPENLAPLISERRYPALLMGRSEGMNRYNGCVGEYRTTTWMEEAFSLGTVDTPLCSGNQTAQLYATYKRRSEVKDFRDAATVFYQYYMHDVPLGDKVRSIDGQFSGERFFGGEGWSYAIQKENTAVLLTVADPTRGPLSTGKMALNVIFPAHYGRISRSIIGAGPVRDGAVGESAEVEPVSVEAGEVFIHIQPLIPTSLPRKAAVRFRSYEAYEALELVNFERDREFVFTPNRLETVLNGMVFTIDDKSKWPSLEAFHTARSRAVFHDYLDDSTRYFRYRRDDVEFEVVYSPVKFGVQTRAVDGRTIPLPVMYTNQFDADTLPLLSGPVAPAAPLFAWGDSLEKELYPALRWMIGARGVDGEKPYSHRTEDLKLDPR